MIYEIYDSKLMKHQTINWNVNLIENYFSKNEKRVFDVSENSNFNYLAFVTESNIEINFDFSWKEWNIFIICFWSGETICKVNTKIDASDSKVDIFILSFLQSDNSINVDWNITMAKDISNSKWHLLEKNIIFWKKIKIKAIPRLDVYSQNVQSSHWVSIDKLDEEKMFYITSRGLSQTESKELIIHSYLQYIFDFFSDRKEDMTQIEQKILSSIKTND